MEARPKISKHPKDQLSRSQAVFAERNLSIEKLQAENVAMEILIKRNNNRIGYLLDAQEVERRIMVLLNYLVVRPDEDKEKLLAQERETQAPILKTLES